MTAQPASARAALWMLVSTFAFGLMAITIRLASKDIATTEIAFFRNAFGLLALLPLIGGTVSIIDPTKREVTGKIKFAVPGLRSEAIQPVGISLTKDGKTGFVALGPANRVAVVDGATHEVKKYLLVGQRVWHMEFTPDEKYLLVTNGVSNDVSVIDVAAQKVIKTIQVGELPWGITIAQP